MGKLVRDKIPDIIRKDGLEPNTRTLNDADYLKELKKKAIEESKELSKTKNKDHFLEELADLEEVIIACLTAIKSDKNALEKIRLEKLNKRGGFSKRIYWKGNKSKE